MFVYVYVDSYLIGMFQHESMDPKPRKLTYEPIDEGVGNGDIFMPKSLDLASLIHQLVEYS